MNDKIYKFINGKHVLETDEEAKSRIEKEKKQELEYTVIEDTPTQSEINFAEYVLATEDRIESLQIEIKTLNGSV